MIRILFFSMILMLSCDTDKAGSVKPLLTIECTYPESYTDQVDGRLFIMLTKNKDVEPRFDIRDDAGTAQIFGMDVEDWNPGETVIFEASSLGYPVESMADLDPSDYYIQALFHKYETFSKSDGHTVKLPMDRGEGQQWNRAPGNVYSSVKQINIDPKDRTTIKLNMDQLIPEIKEPSDTEYVKHIKIRSKLLSDFWGRDMYLGAHVLLPEGFESHPDVYYPLAIMHGHFPADFSGWRTDPPDPTLEPEYSLPF